MPSALQGIGVHRFISEKLPDLRARHAVVIVNICGTTIEEYVELAQILSDAEGVAAIELNISCPNIKEGGITFGCSLSGTHDVVKAVRRVTRLPVFPKLTPNVTDVASLARAAEEAGADAVSLVNTFLAMAIDIHTRRPKLSNVVGGLSGPAIRPVAVRMVYECRQAVRIPIIGMGGITNADDALEFLIAGATAVQIGTATFVDPFPVAESARGNYRLSGTLRASPPDRHRGDARHDRTRHRMDQLLIALDVDTGIRALTLADQLRGAAGGFKVGSRLFTAEGPSVVKALVDRGDRVFLDLKFHDIPSVVAAAVPGRGRPEGLDDHGPRLGWCRDAARRARGRQECPPWSVGGGRHGADQSLRAPGLGELGITRPVLEQVDALARLAQETGLDGVVRLPVGNGSGPPELWTGVHDRDTGYSQREGVRPNRRAGPTG